MKRFHTFIALSRAKVEVARPGARLHRLRSKWADWSCWFSVNGDEDRHTMTCKKHAEKIERERERLGTTNSWNSPWETMCAGFHCGNGAANCCQPKADTGVGASGTRHRCILLCNCLSLVILPWSDAMTPLKESGQKRGTRIEQRTFGEKNQGNLGSVFFNRLFRN